MFDPFTLTLVGVAIVAIVLIIWKKIVQWFRSKRQLSVQDADAVGVLIVERMGNHQYNEVDIGFSNPNATTRMVKAVVSERTGKVLAAEALESGKLPDEETRRHVEAGRGMVVFR